MNNAIKYISILSLLLLAGCGGKKQPPQMLPEVAVVTIQPQRTVLTTELPGRTSAFRIAEIRPQVNGIIQKRLFEEGSEVKAGDVLYRIDPAPFKAALNSAKASLQRAEAGYLSVRLRAERYKDLLSDKAISQQDYDDADAAMKQSDADIEYWKAAVETAEINLQYTKVTAPISGRIGKSTVTDGALVTAYQPVALATIQQLDPIYVDVPQSTAELLKLQRRFKQGQLNTNDANQNKVQLILEDGLPYSAAGTLQFQDITVEPTTGSVVLRVIVPNKNSVLLPGMFVRAIITEGIKEQALLVPQQGVSRNTKGQPVALLVDSQQKVEQRILTVDRAIGDKWLVLSGLNAGDKVIVEGSQKVKPSMPVRTVPFDVNLQSDKRPQSSADTK